MLFWFVHAIELYSIKCFGAVSVQAQAPRSSSSGKLYEDKSLDLATGGNHVAELGSFPQNEDQSKGTFPFFRQEKTNQSAAEGISHKGSTIRPGNAPDVKFAGSGSYPDMGLDNGTRSQW